jgi:hypothetical protein
MFRIESWSQGLMLAQARASMLDFVEKLVPETWHTVFVEDCRCPKFGLRGTVKFDLHRRFS